MDIAAVVGLGNPGAEYALTRHNVGFLVVDEMARRWRLATWRSRYHAKVARRSGGRPTLLVKPQTFYEPFGRLPGSLHGRRGARARAMPCGRGRRGHAARTAPVLREQGGPGTHNGLRSIVDAIGEDFARLRLGIRGDMPGTTSRSTFWPSSSRRSEKRRPRW